MTTSSPIPPLDYDRLRAALADAGSVVALSEVHGGVCGALCADGPAAAKRWLESCFDEDSGDGSHAALGELDELIDSSTKMLDDREFAFEPLLPGDDAPLAEQVEALASWCHGFLNAVGSAASANARAATESGAVAEILRDFAEIGRAGLSEEEAAGLDQPDFALAEIREYVRIGVQTVFEELRAARSGDARDVH